MAKKRNSSKSNLVAIRLYGIWSRIKNKLVYVSVNEDDAEWEFDMGEYSEKKYALIILDTQSDISSLEL